MIDAPDTATVFLTVVAVGVVGVLQFGGVPVAGGVQVAGGLVTGFSA